MSADTPLLVMAHPGIEGTAKFGGDKAAFEKSAWPALGWRLVETDEPAAPAPAAPPATKPAPSTGKES